MQYIRIRWDDALLPGLDLLYLVTKSTSCKSIIERQPKIIQYEIRNCVVSSTRDLGCHEKPHKQSLRDMGTLHTISHAWSSHTMVIPCLYHPCVRRPPSKHAETDGRTSFGSIHSLWPNATCAIVPHNGRVCVVWELSNKGVCFSTLRTCGRVSSTGLQIVPI